MTKSAVFSPSHHCNSSCWMCNALRVGINDYASPDLDEVMTRVQELFDSGVRTIHISGGEPTIWRHYRSFIQKVGGVGFESIGVYTHGRALTKNLVEHSLEAGVDTFLVSLHAADEHLGDRIAAAPGSFRQTLRGLQELARARARFKFTLSLSCVLSSLTEKQLPAIVQLALRFPIDKFQFTYPLHTGSELPLDVEMFPDLTRLESDLDRSITTLRDHGVSVRVNEIPPCFYRHNLSCYSSAASAPDLRVLEGFHSIGGRAKPVRYVPIESSSVAEKVNQCTSCFVSSRCHGIPKTYFERFERIAVHPFTESEVRALVRERVVSAWGTAG